MAVFCFILGIIAFLVMVHPVVFWVVFVPLAIIFVVSLLAFLKKGTLGIKHFTTAMVALIIMIVAIVIVGAL